MKKLLAILLAVSILILALASCNNSSSTQGEITITPSTTEQPTTQGEETQKGEETTSPVVPSQDEGIIPSGEAFWAVTDTYEVRLLRKYGSVDSCAVITLNVTDSKAEFPGYYEEPKTKVQFPVIWIGSGNMGVIGKGSPTEVIIPDSVIAIKSKAFTFQLTIEKVVLNEGIETIESNAFWCCTKLKEVNLPSTLVSIGDNAFQGTAITDLVIPNSVTTIGQTAFASCSNLKTVTLPRRFESQVNEIFGTRVSQITFTYTD